MKNNKFFYIFTFSLLILSLLPTSYVFAWGKRGHETIGSLAAQVLAQKHKGSEFLVNHSFDMGFYNNVPDIVWKSKPEVFKKEFFQHFMDMEEFEDVKSSDWTSDKVSFFKKYPKITVKAGRSWWRIFDLNKELEKKTGLLKQKKTLPIKEQHSYQAKWLLYAGVMGHYIADLSQPLHVTTNYDGKSTGQKGIHHWFEETLVDELYPELQSEVFKNALKQWDEFHKSNSKLSVFELTQQLTKDSQKEIESLLKTDKKIGRKNLKLATDKYRKLIVERLTLGTLYLAEIWSRQTGWNYNGDKFYSFDSSPSYIEP